MPTQKFSFSFSKLKYARFGFNPRKFRQHFTNEMKLNKIDEVLKSANSLFKWVFGLLSSRNFDTMGTWRNDFSSLNRNLQSRSISKFAWRIWSKAALASGLGMLGKADVILKRMRTRYWSRTEVHGWTGISWKYDVNEFRFKGFKYNWQGLKTSSFHFLLLILSLRNRSALVHSWTGIS